MGWPTLPVNVFGTRMQCSLHIRSWTLLWECGSLYKEIACDWWAIPQLSVACHGKFVSRACHESDPPQFLLTSYNCNCCTTRFIGVDYYITQCIRCFQRLVIPLSFLPPRDQIRLVLWRSSAIALCLLCPVVCRRLTLAIRTSPGGLRQALPEQVFPTVVRVAITM